VADPDAGSPAATDVAETGQPAESGRSDDTAQPEAGGTAQSEATAPPGKARRYALASPAARAVAGHLLLLAGFIAAGVAVTWPMTDKLAQGRLLWNPDVSSYVWALWWMAHQVSHLGNPWITHNMAAPVGIQLGFDTLMPLPGLIMTPVTLAFGPAASFAVLTIVTPGLLCYTTYRAARLWIGQPGAIAAGAFFGLSTMLDWQNLFHLNVSIGTIFLPLTLEAAVRLRRRPGLRQGILLGVVLGASVLTNQESAVVAALLAIAVLLPWLVKMIYRGPEEAGPQLRSLLLGVGVAIVVASPQLAAMIGQVASGGTTVQKSIMYQLTQSYTTYGVGLPTLFSPSPRLAYFHLGQLAAAYQFTAHGQPEEARPTFGVILAGLAVLGLILYWRRSYAWWLALLWAVGAALALGPTLEIENKTYYPLATHWHGFKVSQLMPYTWLIRIPGMSALREADRLALLGLLGAAILAGLAVQWLWEHLKPVLATAIIVAVAAAGFLEAGWSAYGATMPSAMPTVDAGIAAGRDPRSIVVDLPFGLRGGVNTIGFRLPPQSLILATEDGHPRAVSYTSWVPQPTINGIWRIPFYEYLFHAQLGSKYSHNGRVMMAVRRSAARRNINWVIVWRGKGEGVRKGVIPFLYAAGFKIEKRATVDDVPVTVWERS
jgi:hypothetical protein